MMNYVNNYRNSGLRPSSSQALPDLGVPPLGAKLALCHADVRRRKADNELALNYLFSAMHGSECIWLSEELADDKMELKKLFLTSNNDIKENKASILRFYEILKDQKEFKVKLKRDIADTKIYLDEYKKVKETMEKYVGEYSIFERFAEDVVAVSNDGLFLSVRDILNKYETLETTRMDIGRILKNEMQTQTELRKEMLEILEKKSAELKNLSNRLVMMQLTCKQAQDHRNYWENAVQQVKNKTIAKEEEKIVLEGACWDLYELACHRRKRQPTLPKHDMEAQLLFIQKSITFYKEVLTIATGAKTVEGKKSKV